MKAILSSPFFFFTLPVWYPIHGGLTFEFEAKTYKCDIQTGHNCCSTFLWVCLLSLLLLLSLRIWPRLTSRQELSVFYVLQNTSKFNYASVPNLRRQAREWNNLIGNRTQMKRGLNKEARVSCSLERVSLRQNILQMQLKTVLKKSSKNCRRKY